MALTGNRRHSGQARNHRHSTRQQGQIVIRAEWKMLALTGVALTAYPSVAQEKLEKQSAVPPERIDILVEPIAADPQYDDCEEDQDAANITGEIVVCRRKSGDEDVLYDKEQAQRRYAEETAFKGDPEAPDFILDCQDQGWPFGCFKMGDVPPPVLLIDLDAIPETPAGSNADRVGRGLAPRGSSAGPDGSVIVAGTSARQADAEQLGLPPPLDESANVSPSGSASPAEEPSG